MTRGIRRALQALAEATGAVLEEEAAADGTGKTAPTPEQMTARLLRLIGP